MAQTTPSASETATEVDICRNCGRNLSRSAVFAFKRRAQTQGGVTTPAAEITKCFRCALRHLPMLKRSGMAALCVGTILTLLNQGDLIFSGNWSNALYWKIPLTYCVPFLVASYGALINNRK
ncbi:MAG: nitrate/nitrite transporter NrtS [Dehalococcoidia bacterium]